MSVYIHIWQIRDITNRQLFTRGYNTILYHSKYYFLIWYNHRVTVRLLFTSVLGHIIFSQKLYIFYFLYQLISIMNIFCLKMFKSLKKMNTMPPIYFSHFISIHIMPKLHANSFILLSDKDNTTRLTVNPQSHNERIFLYNNNS